MPEDPFPQATQEFHPAWVEEDEAVEWVVPEPEPDIEQRSVIAKQAVKRRELPPRGPRPSAANPRGNGRRPAGSPRGRSGRRVLAVLALALIGGALWLINATFQPFHDDPTGAVVVTIPTGADAGQIGTLLHDAGVIDNAKLFEANATVTLRRAKLRPGKYTLPKGMTNGGAIEALMQGPKAKVVKTFKFTLPEGQSIGENAKLVAKGPFEGSYAKAAKSASALRRAHALGLPRELEEPRGLPVPRHLRDGLRRQLERPRQAPARRLRGERRQGADEDRQAAQPDALRRADHRLDGRARGAARRASGR